MHHAGKVTLLHLSDLHFGRHHRFSSDDGTNSLLERLRGDLDKLREQENLTPDIVVVSGDLAEFGKKAEFDRATQFLQKLAIILNLPTNRFVIVPGNHDINRKLCSSYFDECEANDETPQRPYFKKFAFFQEAFDGFYGGASGITFHEQEPWSFFEYPELGVVVAGLNSAYAESHEKHLGFIGETQLRSFVEKLRPYKERGFLRIGVMHHDPRDRRGGEETERDQKQLRELLAPWLNLLLHGDVHADHDDVLRQNVPVLGVGSLGVTLEQRPEEVPNEYQLLQIRAGGIRRFLRHYVPDQQRFLPTARADAAGKTTVVDMVVPFESVSALGQATAPKQETDLEELVEQYRRAIVKDQRVRTVGDLLGREMLNAPMEPLDVLRLFVPQDVLREAPVRHSQRERMRMMRDARDFMENAPDAPLPEPEELDRFSMVGHVDSVAEALARGWVYLLGAPGAGKTALTRWILLSLCVPGEGISGFAEDLVPVRIDMRLFQDRYEKATGEFSVFDFLDAEHGERFLRLRGEPLRELARRGRLYFLFDGLDEIIDESKRHRFAAMISGLATLEEYGRCRGVVTSRVIGAEVAQSIFDGSGFTTYTLRDFSEKQQVRFLNVWHDVVFVHEPEMHAHRRNRLRRALEASSSLRALCGNPLCCSLLAYLNRDEELPEGRHHLYQKILERLAEHWDANKGLPVRNGSRKFELPDKLSFLRRLGGHMMEAGGAEAGNAIAEKDLVAFAQSFCQERWSEAPDAARPRAEALINHLRERNEVLAWLGGDIYGFTHRALLEYSAAARAIELHGRIAGVSDLALWFRRHWRDEAWEETLLLTCGLLREVDKGPALVVQLLQEMAGDRAAVYRELDDYLCFWIKALGELRSLEDGVPRKFADAINGVLEYQIQCEPPKIASYRLLEPFRRCSGKWPNVMQLMQATLNLERKRSGSLDDLFPVWIAASGRTERVRMLLQAITAHLAEDIRGRFVPWTLANEASRLGQWSDEEIAQLCEAAAKGDDNDRYNILADVVHTPGMSFKDDDRIIRELLRMMDNSTDKHVQQSCAYTLIRVNCHQQAAFATLRGFLTSDANYYRHNAARLLCRLGSVNDALPLLVESAEKNWGSLEILLEVARNNDDAMQQLRELVPRLRQHQDMKMVVWSFLIGVRKGYPVISSADMSRRLREQNAEDAERHLDILSREARLTKFLADEYEWFLWRINELPIFRRMAEDALRLEPKHGGEQLRLIWVKLLNCKDPLTVRRAARRILEQPTYSDLIEPARSKMRNDLRAENLEDTRFYAAGVLGLNDADALALYEQLAVSAIDEWTRYGAARSIGNVGAIAALAERAQHSGVKESAREAQSLYAHIHDLLLVGRPRKAIVKRDNDRVGLLEETSVNGGTKFTYDKDYLQKPGARPLAPNLPLRPEPYSHPEKLLPYFANLLPEGTILEQTARRLGLPRTDGFGILLKVGEDVMGAVQIFPEEAN